MTRLRAALLVLCLFSLLPASAQASASARLYVLDAAGGTLTAKGDDRFTLTLRGVDPRTTWFSDRPQRLAGTQSTRGLVGDWKRLGFTADPPNAAIALDGGRRGADTMIVELGRPRYDALTRTLTVAVRRVSTASPALARHSRRADDRLPRRFGRVSLFVDDATAREARIYLFNVLNLELQPLTTMSVLPAATSVTGGAWTETPTVDETIDNRQWVAAFAVADGPDGPFSGTLSASFAGAFPGAVEVTWTWPPGAAAPQWKTTLTGAAADQGKIKVTSIPGPTGDGTMQNEVLVTRGQ